MEHRIEALVALAYGLAAGVVFAFALGTWRKGMWYGLTCGFYTALFMAILALPLYLGFAGHALLK